MSNLELDPPETLCGAEGAGTAPLEVIAPRDVPLGGPRAMPVRRTLPSKQRSLVGGWCFADHYGPDDVSATGGMRVPPHPHTGLQTVSWLFTGAVQHRDSAGHEAIVRPGELNLMTAGRGINHSEYSTADTTVLHGVQLWTALPDPFRDAEPGFERYVPPVVVLHDDGGGPAGELRVFLGALAGSASPVRAYSPLLGAELTLRPGARVTLELASGFEHAVLADSGGLELDEAPVPEAHLAYAAPGRSRLRLANPEAHPVHAVLLGGPPFGEEITMWWNFVGRSHDEIVGYRAAWQAQLGLTEPGPEGVGASGPQVRGAAAAGEATGAHDGARFGPVVEPTGGEGPLPAPPLPHVRLRPRGAAPGAGDVTGTGVAGSAGAGSEGAATRDSVQTGVFEPITGGAGDGVAVRHSPQGGRYEITVGGAVVGFTQYRLKDAGRLVAFDHTMVGEAFSGQGLAGRLVAAALGDVRAKGQRVRPHCPYVRGYLKRHPADQDLVEDGFSL
ncbi:bifunctional pirin family protein/GNAT family N-acetyltransferase [Sinomonas halotolerans]|uniref:Pirin family protein n=1 Tax=Sinomonas halotolerans TaxID=1644133 RepID=A0ABU9X3Z3_9MICC